MTQYISKIAGKNRSPRSDKPKDEEERTKPLNKPCPCSLI